MHDELLNHRITILLKPGCNGPDNRIITESNPKNNYIDAFEDIEKTLNSKYHVPYISCGLKNEIDMANAHAKFGNTVFYNSMDKNNSMFLVYLPEDISMLDMDIVRGMVMQISDVETIIINQLSGEDYVHIDLDTFLHPKLKSVYNSGHNNININKKD